MASAAARAFVEFDGQCVVQGNARIDFQGSAFASARAAAYAEAVSTVLATNNVCPNCTAVVRAVARTSRKLLADASASLTVEVLPGHCNSECDLSGCERLHMHVQHALGVLIASLCMAFVCSRGNAVVMLDP